MTQEIIKGEYLEPYKKAVRREFPDISEDKLAVAAFFAFAMKGKHRVDSRPVGYHQFRQMELDALNEEIIGTQTSFEEVG